jgi:transcriptional regulator with XRE-family HTH domain
MSLKETRTRKNMTQEELSEKSRVDQSTISAIETGRMKRPSWEIVARLAKALDERPERLFPLEQAS